MIPRRNSGAPSPGLSTISPTSSTVTRIWFWRASSQTPSAAVMSQTRPTMRVEPRLIEISLPIDQKSVRVPTRLVAQAAICARAPSQAMTCPMLRSAGWSPSRRSIASVGYSMPGMSITRACMSATPGRTKEERRLDRTA